MKIDLDQVTEDDEERANLEDFVGHLINGLSAEAAIARVWPDKAKPPPDQAKRYCSDVNGSLIGWDMCGACTKHVSRCTCKAGPSEPRYFERLRRDDAIRKARAAGDETKVLELQRAEATTDVPSGSPAPAAPSDQGSSTPAQEATEWTTSDQPTPGSPASSLVPCKPGKHLVPADTADKNDDGSWTCYEHQATSAVRDGTADE